MSTYRLDDELLQNALRSKVDKLSTRDTFEASATLSRVLAKEGIIEADGESAELHTGKLAPVQGFLKVEYLVTCMDFTCGSVEARQKAALDLLAGYLPKEASAILRASYRYVVYAVYKQTRTSCVVT